MAAAVSVPSFDSVNVGDKIGPATFPIQRINLVMYCGASGDFNVIHWNERIATAVGLPNVIAHGMFTMALAARAVVGTLRRGGEMEPVPGVVIAAPEGSRGGLYVAIVGAGARTLARASGRIDSDRPDFFS